MKKNRNEKSPRSPLADSDFHLLTDYYTSRQHEQPEYAAVGWENAEAQAARFAVLLQACPMTQVSLLDIGCGVGSLRQYLRYHNANPGFYTGVDVLPHMIEVAQKRFPDDRWIQGDLFRDSFFPPDSFDVVFASGIFNLRLQDNMSYFRSAVAKFCEIARKTVVCNMLADYAPDPEEKYYYYSVEKVRSIVREYTTELRIITDYLPNDMTLVLEFS